MSQVKEQEATSKEQVSEVERSNLPGKRFRVVILKMIQDSGKRTEAEMKKIQEIFHSDLEELKNKQMKNTIIELKNTLEVINNTVTEAEEWINELENRMVEITDAEQNKEKRVKRNRDSLRDLWDNIKLTNIQIIGIPKEKEKKKGYEKIFGETIAKKIP